MPSEANYVICKNCNNAYFSSFTECPKCKEKNKTRKSWPKWFLGVFLMFVLLIFLSSLSTKTASNSDNKLRINQKNNIEFLPTKQKEFIKVINAQEENFKNAKNELLQSEVRLNRKLLIKETLNNLVIDSWVGEIAHLSTNSEGQAILEILISPNIRLLTWNNMISDISFNTMIPINSNLFQKLKNLEVGQRVSFSGKFFYGEDFIYEKSMTIKGSMKNPEFLFSFSDINLIQ